MRQSVGILIGRRRKKVFIFLFLGKTNEFSVDDNNNNNIVSKTSFHARCKAPLYSCSWGKYIQANIYQYLLILRYEIVKLQRKNDPMMCVTITYFLTRYLLLT
mmetsp:Transcript_25668/g.38129  ORF Transcript_25668/g.38129 Transcript_25668/m.38129 type:complete len:103 (+) Transcript_25668:699-1007(+)